MVGALDVLAAVELDDQFRFQADEVADIATERALPAEAEAVDLATPQVFPQQPFGIGRVPSQASGKVVHAA